MAAVDLQAFAVAKHIPLDDAPSQVIASPGSPFVYAVTPLSGSIHEIQADRLSFRRKVKAASATPEQVMTAALSPDDTFLYLLSQEPRAVSAISTESLKVVWRLMLPEEPMEFAVANNGKTAAITSGASVRLLDLSTRELSPALGHATFGSVRFLDDSKTLIAADLGNRRLSLYDVASRQLITHLPLTIRPDHMCFSHDGGQLFLTGEGTDGVVIVYPYHIPRVAKTVLAGHAPGAMAASGSLLFIASPQSGDVSILSIATAKIIGVVQVGSDPGFVVVTPDDQYALVLNRRSGDVAVLRAGGITPNRYKSWSLFTVIPVGSKPVSAAIRAIS